MSMVTKCGSQFKMIKNITSQTSHDKLNVRVKEWLLTVGKK